MQQNSYWEADGNYTSMAVTMNCHGATLVGVLDKPSKPASVGMVIVVGGPQYRIGSHRQFVELSRQAAAAGVPTLRFDHRGIGDSAGDRRPFYAINDDIRAAIDCLCTQCHGVQKVVLWGLCDAATAILMYANRDRRLGGVVLLNPWFESRRAQARSFLNYAWRRLRNPQFWRRLNRREVQLGAALRELAANAYRTFIEPDVSEAGSAEEKEVSAREDWLGRELARFHGAVLLILSGDDLTAETFRAMVRRSGTWRDAMSGSNVMQVQIPGADHTFSRTEWANRVHEETLDWLAKLR